ncbi:hypothetical protein GCM10023149_28120 [Mucilaginibacter gynuensis]|uniref:Glycosyltransferase RgtA/B/C/D-like domain-containing protein n=1 Tax=Mucilaginibacter gynuensis TaxID=1302236 RepID=A0ABP8GKJ8_9SPHI
MQATAVNKPADQEKLIWYFLSCWTLLNIVQACTLQLHPDEAYYWMYSRLPAWGYFDHPPMVAMFIRLGDSIVHNEFGLRLVNILASTASLYLLWRIAKKYNVDALRFILITGGIFTFHIYGFITTPDGPLLFFTVLFFYFYRKYLAKDGLLPAIILGLVVGGLLYSKYHAVLLIGFTVLANIKILTRWSFWVIVLLATGLYLPHIMWQVNNDYPSLAYHLSDRSARSYQIDYTLVYFLSQTLMAGPLIGWFLFYKSATVRIKDAFTRVLLVNAIGIILFFLITSIRGEVQPQWTIIALAAIVLLVMIRFGQDAKVPAWFNRVAIANMAILVTIRLLVLSSLPFVEHIAAMDRFFHKKEWAQTIHQKVGDNYLVMNTGFQEPARYNFYTNTLKGFSYDSRYYRLTQFEIWPLEDSIQHKRVYYLASSPMPGITKDTIKTADGDYFGVWVDDVRTYQKVNFVSGIKKMVSSPGKQFQIRLSVTNPYNHRISFTNTGYKMHVFLEACFVQGDAEVKVEPAGDDFHNINLKPGETTSYVFNLTAPDKKGVYDLMFSLRTGPFQGSKNGRVINISVE